MGRVKSTGFTKPWFQSVQSVVYPLTGPIWTCSSMTMLSKEVAVETWKHRAVCCTTQHLPILVQRGNGCHFNAKLQMKSTSSVKNQQKSNQSNHLGPQTQHPSCLQQTSNLCNSFGYTHRGFSTAFMRNICHFSWVTCHQDHDQALLYWVGQSRLAVWKQTRIFCILLFLCSSFVFSRWEPFAFANGSLLQAYLCDIACFSYGVLKTCYTLHSFTLEENSVVHEIQIGQSAPSFHCSSTIEASQASKACLKRMTGTVLVNPDHVFIQLVNGCRKHIQNKCKLCIIYVHHYVTNCWIYASTCSELTENEIMGSLVSDQVVYSWSHVVRWQQPSQTTCSFASHEASGRPSRPLQHTLGHTFSAVPKMTPVSSTNETRVTTEWKEIDKIVSLCHACGWSFGKQTAKDCTTSTSERNQT